MFQTQKKKPSPCLHCGRAVVPAGYGFWPDPSCDGVSCPQGQVYVTASSVMEEAMKLRKSGYTGTSFVDVTRRLFRAVDRHEAALEKLRDARKPVAYEPQTILNCGHDPHDPYCGGNTCKPAE